MLSFYVLEDVENADGLSPCTRGRSRIGVPLEWIARLVGLLAGYLEDSNTRA